MSEGKKLRARSWHCADSNANWIYIELATSPLCEWHVGAYQSRAAREFQEASHIFIAIWSGAPESWGMRCNNCSLHRFCAVINLQYRLVRLSNSPEVYKPFNTRPRPDASCNQHAFGLCICTTHQLTLERYPKCSVNCSVVLSIPWQDLGVYECRIRCFWCILVFVCICDSKLLLRCDLN